MTSDLHRLPNIWSADALMAGAHRSHLPSGHPALDAALGGGWPDPALIELLADQDGIGELTLLMPLLRQACARRGDAVALWLNTPYPLHALALAQHGLDPARQWVCRELPERDAAWAMELGLKSGACSIVIGWLRRTARVTMRRLKLATGTAATFGVVLRPRCAATTPSPASVRIALEPQATGLKLELLKAQGRRPSSLVIDIGMRLDRQAGS